MTTLINKAAQIAAVAHHDQKRKQDETPYIAHPTAVALSLAQHGFPEPVIAAALVHDVLEDTDYPAAELQRILGEEVYAMVQALTYDEALSWEERRKKYAATVRAAPEGVKAISIADKINNAQSLLMAYASEGKHVWSYFTHGKEKKLWFEHLMLDTFKDTWQHPLVEEYAALVAQLDRMEG